MSIKRFVALLSAPLLFLGGAVAPLAAASDGSFEANLSGEEEVPSVDTDAWGHLSIMFNGDSADIEAEGEGLKDVTGAHLHCGWEGENGPIVADLFNEASEDVGEEIDTETYHKINFDLEDEDVKDNADCGDYDIANLEDLANAASDGYIYANVHTEEHSNGEIRGQLEENGGRNNSHNSWSDNSDEDTWKSDDHDWENDEDNDDRDWADNNKDDERDWNDNNDHEDNSWSKEDNNDWEDVNDRWDRQRLSGSDDRSWEGNHDKDWNDDHEDEDGNRHEDNDEEWNNDNHDWEDNGKDWEDDDSDNNDWNRSY